MTGADAMATLVWGLGEIAKVLNCSTDKVKSLARAGRAGIAWDDDGRGRRYRATLEELEAFKRSRPRQLQTTPDNS